MAECTDYLLGDLQAYFPMILNCVFVCFSPQNANLHSPRERLCLVWSYTRKCISRGVVVRKVKNFKHSQKDSCIFNICWICFTLLQNSQIQKWFVEKQLAYGSSRTEDPVCQTMILTSDCVCQKDVAEQINVGFFKWWHFYFSALPVMSNPCAHRGFHLILSRRASLWWQLMPRTLHVLPMASPHQLLIWME